MEITITTPKGERKIGPGQPTFIIAEMSGNHNQSIERAYEIIDAAVNAGVDAVKLQTFSPDSITIDCDNEYFQVKVNDSWKGQTLYNLYKAVYTPWEWQLRLKEYGESKGVLVFSTPVEKDAVDFLETIAVEIYKVASFEIGHLELLERIGSTKKPVILSRGMANIEEIELAVKTLKNAGAPEIAVLHCVSSYPATPEEMNLSTIPDMAKRFQVIAGLSDHTLGIAVSLTAVALGANIIEKHLTLRRADGGADANFSLEPSEMKQLVLTVRDVEKSIGVPTYQVGAKEKENSVFKRSLFVVKNMKVGEVFTSENVRCIRPGYGLAPKFLPNVLGKKAKFDLERGTPLKWDLII